MGEIQERLRLKTMWHVSQLVKNNVHRLTPTLSGEGREYIYLFLHLCICRCLPPDTTWHKVKSPKAN